MQAGRPDGAPGFPQGEDLVAPTPFAEVNVVLRELQPGVREALRDQFVGMYLSGSLAAGGFDRASDVDFVVVTEQEVAGRRFERLDALHQRIATLDPWPATQLDGTYISRRAIRRFDPARSVHANLDRGAGERLKMTQYDEGWVVHCFVLRERGIRLEGPHPRTLIDPVTPEDLQNAMRGVLRGWATRILDDPGLLDRRGYQAYAVLSLCRILYTLRFGDVASKPAAARWARETLGPRWTPVIERAWTGRRHPDRMATVRDVHGTLALIREVLGQAD